MMSPLPTWSPHYLLVLLLLLPSAEAHTHGETLTGALQTAGVRNPAAMSESLLRHELLTVTDVAELNAAEGAELFDGLRAASIPLGDRARLRKAVGRHGLNVDEREQMVNVVSPRRMQGEPNNTEQAEEDKGVSSDVIAIILTGLTAVTGYVLQARQVHLGPTWCTLPGEPRESLPREPASRERQAHPPHPPTIEHTKCNATVRVLDTH
jgi:hypothetical protein